MMKNRKNRKKGFTLVECIVAMAVISIVTSAAIGVYMSAQSSTNREWDKFMATTVADDSVSAFQSAENLAGFKSRKPDGMVQLGDASDGEDEVITEEVPIPFKSIRAYESGKVKFFNHSIDKSNDTYSDPIATFSYGSLSKYTTDKKFLDDSGSLYSSAKHEDTSVLTTSAFTFSQTKGTTHMSMGGERTDPNKATIAFLDGKISITDNSGKKGEYDMTPLEEYLVSNGMFLGFADNTNTGNTMCPTPIMNESSKVFYFYIYQLDYTKSPIVASKIKSGRNYKVLKVTYDNAPFASADKNSWNNEKYIHVTSVKWDWIPLDDYTGDNTSQGKYEEYFTDDSGNKFEDFDWYGFPLFAYYCNGTQDEGRTPDWELKNSISNTKTVAKLIYTDYTLKNTAYKIDFALYKSSETKLYTKENSNTMLFKYTGGDAKSVLTSLGLEKRGTKDDYDKYQKVKETVIKNHAESGYYYYLPEDNSMGCFVKVCYSESFIGERKIDAWLLKKSALNDLKNAQPEEIEALLPEKADFSYRKG